MTPVSPKIRILIADDHPIVRRGLALYLAQQDGIELSAEADDAESALQLTEQHRPDVLLLDLLMPGHGLEALRKLRARKNPVRVIVLTSAEERLPVSAALRAGADSYLLKDSAPEYVLDAIRRTAAGESVFHPRIMPFVASGLTDIAGADMLSQREREVLMMIAEGTANQAIADRLGIGIKTVKTHVSNVLAKLSVEDRTQAAVFAWREGLQKT